MATTFGQFVLKIEHVPLEVWSTIKFLLLASRYFRGVYDARVISSDTNDRSVQGPLVSVGLNCSRVLLCIVCYSGHWHVSLSLDRKVAKEELLRELQEVLRTHWLEGGVKREVWLRHVERLTGFSQLEVYVGGQLQKDKDLPQLKSKHAIARSRKKGGDTVAKQLTVEIVYPGTIEGYTRGVIRTALDRAGYETGRFKLEPTRKDIASEAGLEGASLRVTSYGDRHVCVVAPCEKGGTQGVKIVCPDDLRGQDVAEQLRRPWRPASPEASVGAELPVPLSRPVQGVQQLPPSLGPVIRSQEHHDDAPQIQNPEKFEVKQWYDSERFYRTPHSTQLKGLATALLIAASPALRPGVYWLGEKRSNPEPNATRETAEVAGYDSFGVNVTFVVAIPIMGEHTRRYRRHECQIKWMGGIDKNVFLRELTEAAKRLTRKQSGIVRRVSAAVAPPPAAQAAQAPTQYSSLQTQSGKIVSALNWGPDGKAVWSMGKEKSTQSIAHGGIDWEKTYGNPEIEEQVLTVFRKHRDPETGVMSKSLVDIKSEFPEPLNKLDHRVLGFTYLKHLITVRTVLKRSSYPRGYQIVGEETPSQTKKTKNKKERLTKALKEKRQQGIALEDRSNAELRAIAADVTPAILQSRQNLLSRISEAEQLLAEEKAALARFDEQYPVSDAFRAAEIIEERKKELQRQLDELNQPIHPNAEPADHTKDEATAAPNPPPQ